MQSKQGSLAIVGIGIKLISHLTVEAKAHIEQADKVFYLVTGQLAAEWVTQLNSTAESLRPLYQLGKRRLDTYHDMVKHILAAVQQGQKVCAVFYGHPGVFVLPSHEAIKQAQAQGFTAFMLPGISAEDCLFADLGIDPAAVGCQSFEATDFLVYHRRFDPHSALILWQIGVIGQLRKTAQLNPQGLHILTEVLGSYYPAHHLVTVYEAAQSPLADPIIQSVKLEILPQTAVSAISTLYVPPKPGAELDLNMVKQLGLDVPDLYKDW